MNKKQDAVSKKKFELIKKLVFTTVIGVFFILYYLYYKDYICVIYFTVLTIGVGKLFVINYNYDEVEDDRLTRSFDE